MVANKAEAGSYSQINMTPLIDVMLVLLIIFIITIPTQTHAIKIDNPAGAPVRPPDAPEPIDLSIDFDGTIAWNKHTVDRPALLGHIRYTALQSVQPEVHLTVDRSTHYQVVAQTLADLQRLGLKRIGFANEGAP